MCLFQLCIEAYHPLYLHPSSTFLQHTLSHLEIMIQLLGHMPCLVEPCNSSSCWAACFQAALYEYHFSQLSFG